MQFSVIFWMELNLSSKHLPFFSFQVVHQMQEGITLNHLFCDLLSPLLIQVLSRSDICSRMVSCEVKDQSWTITLQCRKSWLFVSAYLRAIWNFLFCKASCVSTDGYSSVLFASLVVSRLIFSPRLLLLAPSALQKWLLLPACLAYLLPKKQMSCINCFESLPYFSVALWFVCNTLFIFNMLCTSKRSMNGPWLLFVSESGYGKRVPVSRFRTSPLNRVGLIGYKVHHNAISESIIKDKNPYHCLSSLHMKKEGG